MLLWMVEKICFVLALPQMLHLGAYFINAIKLSFYALIDFADDGLFQYTICSPTILHQLQCMLAQTQVMGQLC